MGPPEMEDDNMGEILNEEEPEDEKNETNEEKKGDEKTQDNEETPIDADNDVTPEPRERFGLLCLENAFNNTYFCVIKNIMKQGCLSVSRDIRISTPL